MSPLNNVGGGGGGSGHRPGGDMGGGGGGGGGAGDGMNVIPSSSPPPPNLGSPSKPGSGTGLGRSLGSRGVGVGVGVGASNGVDERRAANSHHNIGGDNRDEDEDGDEAGEFDLARYVLLSSSFPFFSPGSIFSIFPKSN